MFFWSQKNQKRGGFDSPAPPKRPRRGESCNGRVLAAGGALLFCGFCAPLRVMCLCHMQPCIYRFTRYKQRAFAPAAHGEAAKRRQRRTQRCSKRQLPFRTAKLLDYDCLSGDFGKSTAGFKVKNYLIGAQRLAAAGECAILFITGKRTADR